MNLLHNVCIIFDYNLVAMLKQLPEAEPHTDSHSGDKREY